MDATAVLIAVLGGVASGAVFVVAYWDATRVEMGRPLLWATIAAVPVLVGMGLYLFATVPTTGVIMTANTGLVLYTFEREILSEDDEDVEPGALPHGSATEDESNDPGTETRDA